MGISLDKVASEAPELLSLAKNAQQTIADRHLTELTAEVALVLDISISMESMYQTGAVQRLLDKTLALATQLDDDGQIDLFVFESQARYVGTVTLANYRNIVKDVVMKMRFGGTDYGHAFEEVVGHYNHGALGTRSYSSGFFGKKVTGQELSTPADHPVLALFVTDGMTQRADAAVESLRAASFVPIFWQFLSIGPNIPFLQKLDDTVKGRYIDNADYKNTERLDDLTDDQLFDLVLDEYPSWVKEERKRGQIV